jgi:hypothetical protein
MASRFLELLQANFTGLKALAKIDLAIGISATAPRKKKK